MPIDAPSLSIVSYPAPVLRRRAESIDPITDEVRAVAERMTDLMREAEGLGLAAPQVGLPWRMFVTAAIDDQPQRVHINPGLSAFTADLALREEGCLSLPGINVEIRRPAGVSLTSTDLDGAAIELTGEGLAARVWQHECDHLDGILIIDKMNPLDRIACRKAIKELEAAATPYE